MMDEAPILLKKLIRRKNLDAVLFLSIENLRYLCGFTGSDGALIFRPGEKVFLSDFRYEVQAREEIRGAALQVYKQKVAGVAAFLRSARVKRLGFEAGAMTYEAYQSLRSKLPRVDLIPLTREISGLRACKQPEEVEKIRQAIRIASQGFTDTLPRLKPGAKERWAAEYLESRMKHHGGEKLSFDTIVASGPRSALPHGAPTDRRMQTQENVVVDYGVCCQGYHSDETKTLLLGKPDSRQQKIYDTVRQAQEKAMKTIRPGVHVRHIDAAAREWISRAGYGKYFGHGLGHGVGLAVHEEPRLSSQGQGVVKQGMVITVEPGIYIPGWGGVRLEDMVLVTARGCEVLTILSKDLKDNIIAR